MGECSVTKKSRFGGDVLAQIKREKTFFENSYSSQDEDSTILRLNPEASVSLWFDDAIRRMGNLRGKQVIDLGCGSGVSTVYMALRGAEVTAVDISDRALNLCKLRAEANGVSERMYLCNCPIEFLSVDIAKRQFDIVHGCAILHHLDLKLAIPAISSLMKRGSRAYFSETSYLNPFFRFCREKISGRFGVPRVRTNDETPLDKSSFALLKKHFKQVQVLRSYRFFAQATGYIPMNKKMNRVLNKLDKYVLTLPPLRLAGYWVLIECVF